MTRKLALLAVLGTGTGLLASAATGVARLDGDLAAAAAMDQQHRLLEITRDRMLEISSDGRGACAERRHRPARADREL